MILATLVLLGGFFFSKKFINQHQEDSPFNIQDTSETPLASEAVLEKENKPSEMKIEDNEILSAVLFEMKGQQDLEKDQKQEEE